MSLPRTPFFGHQYRNQRPAPAITKREFAVFSISDNERVLLVRRVTELFVFDQVVPLADASLLPYKLGPTASPHAASGDGDHGRRSSLRYRPFVFLHAVEKGTSNQAVVRVHGLRWEQTRSKQSYRNDKGWKRGRHRVNCRFVDAHTAVHYCCRSVLRDPFQHADR